MMLCALALAVTVAVCDFNLAFMESCVRLWDEAVTRRVTGGPALDRAACPTDTESNLVKVDIPEMYRAKAAVKA